MDFRYQAVDRQGKLFEGVLAAETEQGLLLLLQQQDLTPVSLQPLRARKTGWRRPGERVSHQATVLVLRELATLLAAGVSLAEAVDSTSQAHEQGELGPALARVHAQLRGGAALSDALRTARLAFPEYLFQLLLAGEMTGKVADALLGAADQMDYERRIRQDMRNALTYPAILVLSGVAATLLIFIVVVPRFSNMLKSTRANIPDMSRWVLEAGLFAKDHLLWLSLGAAAVVAGVALALSNPALRQQGMDAASRLPLVGQWLRNSEIGRWATMLGTLLANKVPVVQAMALAQSGVRITSIAQRLQLALRDLRAGKKLAEALALHQTVNAMGINLVRVGERSGELPKMLTTLGRIYEEASRDRMKRFLTLLEPLTILIVGSVIGFIMVAIMLAITSLSTATL